MDVLIMNEQFYTGNWTGYSAGGRKRLILSNTRS